MDTSWTDERLPAQRFGQKLPLRWGDRGAGCEDRTRHLMITNPIGTVRPVAPSAPEPGNMRDSALEPSGGCAQSHAVSDRSWTLRGQRGPLDEERYVRESGAQNAGTVRVLRLAACCSALPPVDDQATWTTSLSRFRMTSGNDTMRRPSAAATRARGSRGLQAPPPFSSRETDCVVPIRAGGGGQFSAAEPEPKRRGRQYQVRHCRSRPPRRCVSAAGSPDVPSEAEEPPLMANAVPPTR